MPILFNILLYVLNMADGIWSLAIGDDDTLGEEFNELIRLIDNANKEINWCDKTKFLETTTSSKIKISRKLGKYLVYHGKGKQGLQYLRLAKSYIEDLYEREHPKTLSENILYERMSNLVN